MINGMGKNMYSNLRPHGFSGSADPRELHRDCRPRQFESKFRCYRALSSKTAKPTNSLYLAHNSSWRYANTRESQAGGKLEGTFREAVRALAKLEQTNATDGHPPTHRRRSWEEMWGSIPLSARLRRVFDRCRSE